MIVTITNKATGEKTYKVESSRPGQFYSVSTVNGKLACTCPDCIYRHNHACKHIQRVAAKIQAEQKPLVQRQADAIVAKATSQEDQWDRYQMARMGGFY